MRPLFRKIGQLNLNGSRYPSAVVLSSPGRFQMQALARETARRTGGLGIALVTEEGRRRVAVFREGSTKFPLATPSSGATSRRSGQAGNSPWKPPTAPASPQDFQQPAGEMNEIYRRSHASLSPPDSPGPGPWIRPGHHWAPARGGDKARPRRQGLHQRGSPAGDRHHDRGPEGNPDPGLGRIEVGKPSTVKIADQSWTSVSSAVESRSRRNMSAAAG